MAEPHTVYLLGSSHLESAVNKATESPQSSGSVSSCLLVEAQDGGLTDTMTDRQALEKPEWLPGTAQVPSYQQSREAEVCPHPWLCQPVPSLSSNCSVGRLLVGMVQRLTVTMLVGSAYSVLTGSFYILFGEMSIQTFWTFLKRFILLLTQL